MDRISELPDFIIHHILSFLTTIHPPPAELVRMSVLSKKWFDLTASFPVLDFSFYGFRDPETFFKYVEYATTRFCHQNVTAHKFKLVTTLWDPTEVDIINRCLELILKNGVRELDIRSIDSSSPPVSALSMPMYRLPNVLLYASELESLKIYGCGLPSSLMVGVVKFKSLTHLNLDKVPIADEVIKSLTTSCPLLQVLETCRSRGLKRFCIHGHQNLKKVDIFFDTPLEIIDIEAPNLFDLSVRNVYRRAPPLMKLASCKKLTTVHYSGYPLPHDFLSNFPFVENFHLHTKCSNVKWSSHSLRTLVLESDCDLEDMEFSTPNLVLFMYACNIDLYWLKIEDKWPLFRDLTHLKGCMHFYANNYIDTLWFQKLRRFLNKKNGFKVLNLYIHASYSQTSTEFVEVKAIELSPYELEHVELELHDDASSSYYVAFVNALLLCCHPRSLTLRPSYYLPDFGEQTEAVKFTCKKLVEQEDQGHTKIQIVWPSSTEAQKQMRDLRSSSVALLPESNAISFIKEEVVQEEA